MNFVLVTSLPRDRLSQVTRRGMLTYTKSQSQSHTAGQSEEQQHVGYQRKTELSIKTSGGPAAGREVPREQTRKKERDEADLWEPTSELNLLEPEESDMVRIPLSSHICLHVRGMKLLFHGKSTLFNSFRACYLFIDDICCALLRIWPDCWMSRMMVPEVACPTWTGWTTFLRPAAASSAESTGLLSRGWWLERKLETECHVDTLLEEYKYFRKNKNAYCIHCNLEPY